MKYFKQIDGLRAIAIIGVMIAHWYQSSINIAIIKNIPYGTGVTLFFVLSGFLITSIIIDFKEKNILANKSQFSSIKSFYIRRSLRIFPIYYLTLIFLLIIGFANTKELFPWLSTFTTNVYMTINSKYIGSYNHFWSLAVEEQFYLLWIFIVVFTPTKHIKKAIIMLIVLSVIFLVYFMLYTKYWLANSLVICQMHSLGAGALIAYYLKYKNEFFENLSLPWIKRVTLILVIIFFFLFVLRRPYSLFEIVSRFKDPAITVIYFLVVLIAVKDGFNGIIKFILENKIMVYIGKISYGLYVYHLFMGPLYFNFLNRYIHFQFSAFGYFIVFFIINMLIASLSWYLIERPAIGLKKYFKY